MGVIRHTMLRRAGAFVLAGGLVAGLAAAPAAVLAGSTIVVTTSVNEAADDGVCSLREAITAANTDTASGATSGECLAGDGTDAIRFEIAGAIVLTSGNELPAITEAVTIDGNDAVQIDGNNEAGTGICACSSGVTVRELQIRAVNGNAVQVTGSATLSNLDIWANRRGINVDAGSTLSLADSKVRGNEGTTGSGIYVNEGGTATIVRTTIDVNTSAAEGGGIRMVGSTVTIDRSTVSGNGAADGAGIYMESPTGLSTLNFYNSTITENIASDEGGAIYRQGNIDIRSSTIARNQAGASGGGVQTDGGPWTFAMTNAAILGNHVGGNPSDWTATGELVNAVSSQVGTAGMAFGDFFYQYTPEFNGGTTKTLLPNRYSDNPLIDGGNATACAAAPISGKDQRGYVRLNPCDIGAVDLDQTKPVVSGVKVALRQGQQLSGSTGTSSLGRLSWTGADTGSGVAHYTVQRRIDGGSWLDLATDLLATSFNVTLGRTHDYAFRVRAIDNDGNVGSFVSSATFEARLYQQTSGAFAYGGSWATSSAGVFSGGSTRRSTTSGSSARFTATGRSFAWITTTGPTRGRAKIYVNGTLVTTIDLYSATTTYRVQAWTRSYSSSVSKTIRIVVSGSGERVDLDALAVLR